MIEQERLSQNQIESSHNVTLGLLRNALNNKDRDQLRMVVDGIKRIVDDRDDSLSIPMTDSELDELLLTGEGVILVGTGTAGSRIFINSDRGDLHMSDDKYGEKYRNKFRRLFDLPSEGEARVSF